MKVTQGLAQEVGETPGMGTLPRLFAARNGRIIMNATASRPCW